MCIDSPRRAAATLLLAACGLLFGFKLTRQAIAQTSAPDWELPTTQIYTNLSNGTGPVIADINGDGLPDMMFSFSTQTTYGAAWGQWVRLNNGRGWDMVMSCSYDPQTRRWSGDCEYKNS